MPWVSPRRCQSGYAQHLRDAMPNATFVAFTGRPVSGTDRDTRAVFGDYIHLRKYKYPPDLQDTTVGLVLAQAQALGESWVA